MRPGRAKATATIFGSCPSRVPGNGTLYLVLANSLPMPGRLRTLLVAAILGLGLLAGPLALPAHAEGTAQTFVVEASLDASGRLAVTQTITFTGDVPGELVQKFETREDLVGDRQYVLDVSDVTATAGGATVTPNISEDRRFTTVTVPTSGATDVVISYTVTGAVVNITDGTALRVRLLQGLSAQVAEFTATVQIPGQFSYIKCTAGDPNSTTPCTFAAAGTEAAQVPTFRDGPRGEGQVVAVEIGFPPGTVAANEQIAYRWTVARAFSARPLPLALALGLLVLGGIGLFALHRRTGTDASAADEISRVGEFVPTGAGQSEFRVVGEIRPGHIGTVADERVDPIDVTATVVDLAVRGHLKITELPRTGEFARTDWELRRVSGGPNGLRPFESQLLDGIAPQGSGVKVSELTSRVNETIGGVQDALYDEVVSNGWFDHRPDATRSRFTQLALGGLIAAVAITAVLAAFTTFGLVGLALVILALGLVFVAQELPARTAQGAALLGGLGALRSDLLSHPTDQMPPGAELREISEVLPYAIVLGGTDRWLDAIVAADTDDDADVDDLPWYSGPPNWHLRDLPDSMKNFVTTVSGSLFSR